MLESKHDPVVTNALNVTTSLEDQLTMVCEEAGLRSQCSQWRPQVTKPKSGGSTAFCKMGYPAPLWAQDNMKENMTPNEIQKTLVSVRENKASIDT